MALLLLPRLKETAAKPMADQPINPPSITLVTSELSHVAKFPERKTAATGQILATLSDASRANMADRYMVSKLFQIYGVRELAITLGPASSAPVIVNTANPGVNDTALLRKAWRTGLGAPEWLINLAVPLFARRPEVGAAAIVAGTELGCASHGEYLSDGIPAVKPPLALGAEGERTQRAVWTEIVGELEKASPGIMRGV